ncbi:MAG: hypothetical protein PSV22_05085, partial [Pseudolabrys sp.]|nr:hypothetical protein [Pseudolabrys sp.]
ENTIEHRFTEAESFRATDFRYAEEKREAEALLERQFAAARASGSEVTVAVLRPAAVTGPRGRKRRSQIGLQAAMSGQLTGNTIHRIVSTLMSFVPVTQRWCWQFIHEDDIADIVALAAFATLRSNYDVLNVAPPGEIVRPRDVAQAFGRRLVRVHPQLVRLVFFLAWHGTRGRIPTPRGAWKPYCYPIVVDGSKLTTVYGYRYRMESIPAFTQNVGRFAS